MEIVKEVRDRMKEASDFSGWDDLWKNGLTPWDLGGPTPLLIEELQQERNRGGVVGSTLKTLVPGCGSGYDIATLVNHHDELLRRANVTIDSVVVGLDISPTSLERPAELVKAIDKGSTRVELKCGDFFSNDWETVHAFHRGAMLPTESDAKFDFIYDYTFFCALPPSLRQAWGERMSTLLRPDTGRLFTIMYPILPNEDVTKGPPYPVTVDDYRQSLEPVGITSESEPFGSPHTVPSRAGKELACFWRLKTRSRL